MSPNQRLSAIDLKEVFAGSIHFGDKIYQEADQPPLFVGVPPLPKRLVGRQELLGNLIESLVSGTRRYLSVEGLPGVGKTTLVTALAYAPKVREHFEHGVLWASLGPQPDLTRVLANWLQELLPKCDFSRLVSEEERAQVVKDAIGQRRMLFVLDDAWQLETANLLRCGGPECCHLLTTRDKAIARAFDDSRPETIPTLGDEPSFQLLAAHAPEACATDPEAVKKLAFSTGGLPLTLELLGGYLAAPERSYFPELSAEAIAELGDPRVRLQLAQKRLGQTSSKRMTLEETIALSLQGLDDKTVAAFYALGAFAAKPARFEREAALAVSAAQPRTLALLIARNLIEAQPETLAIHQVLADVAHTRLDPAAVARHRQYYLLQLQARRGLDAVFLDAHLFQQIKRAWAACSDSADALTFFDLLHGYFITKGMFEPIVEWGERLLGLLAEDAQLQVRARVLVAMSLACNELHSWDQAIRLSMRAVQLLEESGDELGVGRVYANLGMYYLENGDASTAATYGGKAVKILEEQDDYWGIKQIWLARYDLFTRMGDNEVAKQIMDSLEDIKRQEMAALGREQAATELSPIEMASIARDRSQMPGCLPLLLMQYWLIDAKAPRKTRILLGVHKKERGKDVYHYLVVRGEAGQPIEPRIIIVEQSLRGKVKDCDLYLVTDEETLTRVLLDKTTLTHINILELEGDPTQLEQLVGLLTGSARPADGLDSACRR